MKSFFCDEDGQHVDISLKKKVLCISKKKILLSHIILVFENSSIYFFNISRFKTFVNKFQEFS